MIYHKVQSDCTKFVAEFTFVDSLFPFQLELNLEKKYNIFLPAHLDDFLHPGIVTMMHVFQIKSYIFCQQSLPFRTLKSEIPSSGKQAQNFSVLTFFYSFRVRKNVRRIPGI